MGKVKICYISHPDLTHTRRWVDWFSRHNHEVCLIADFPHQIPWPGMHIFDLSKRFRWTSLRYLPWAIWTRQIVREWQPDILHAHRVNSGGWLGWATSFHPFVVTPWGSDLFLHPKRSFLAAILARNVLTSADLITINSTALGQTSISYGARSDRLHMIQWGVDPGVYNPSVDSTGLKQKLGIPEGSRVVLSPRALSDIYNIDIIVKCIPEVKKAFPNAIFLLRDYNTNSGYKQDIIQLIKDLDVGEMVRWLGSLPWEENARTYTLAEIAVSVPSSDSMPVSVLEAMACGLPVIASDLPSIRELIEDGVNGSFVPVKDTQALSQAIIGLFEDKESQKRYSQHGIDLVQTRANHQLEMEKMEGLYLSLLR